MDEIDSSGLDPVTRGDLAASLLSMVRDTAALLGEIAAEVERIRANPEAVTDGALSALANRYQELLDGAGEELDGWFTEEDDARAAELDDEEDSDEWGDEEEEEDWDDDGPDE